MPYTPPSVPESAPLGFRGWLQRELQRLARFLRTPDGISFSFDVLATPPDKPSEGEVVYLSSFGTPDQGNGLYVYTGTTWEKL